MRKAFFVSVLCTSLALVMVAPGRAFPPPPVCNSWVDLIDYFLPSYPGWQTAKITWQGSDGSSTFFYKQSYGPNRLELIKFNDPHSAETFIYDSDWIYITSENGFPDGTSARVWPAGYNTTYLGLNWLPRVGCSSGVGIGQYNQFVPCYQNEVYYRNCTTCPCQLDHSTPTHCAKIPSGLRFLNYNYGGSLGTIATVIKVDNFDDWSGGEKYFYGLGRGLLRFEVFNAQGQTTSWGQQTSEVFNQPLTDQVCFHP